MSKSLSKTLQSPNVSDGPICSVCRKRFATRRCDFPIGSSHYIGHPPRSQMQEAKMYDVAWKKVEMSKTITCDKLLCERCTIRMPGEFDFCPECSEKIKKK